MPLITTTSALMYLTSITEGVCLDLREETLALITLFLVKISKTKRVTKIVMTKPLEMEAVKMIFLETIPQDLEITPLRMMIIKTPKE